MACLDGMPCKIVSDWHVQEVVFEVLPSWEFGICAESILIDVMLLVIFYFCFCDVIVVVG